MFSSINTCWTLVGAFLVYFMQAGFALCEAGFTRAKNTGNILMKNMMDFCIGTPCYWIIGFGLMFGGTGALIGGFDPFIQGDYSHLGLDIPLWVYIVFQTVFCATAATIVSGSMAERTNFKAYCVYSAAISLVVYPICGHWMWGGGWHSARRRCRTLRRERELCRTDDGRFGVFSNTSWEKAAGTGFRPHFRPSGRSFRKGHRYPHQNRNGERQDSNSRRDCRSLRKFRFPQTILSLCRGFLP